MNRTVRLGLISGVLLIVAAGGYALLSGTSATKMPEPFPSLETATVAPSGAASAAPVAAVSSGVTALVSPGPAASGAVAAITLPKPAPSSGAASAPIPAQAPAPAPQGTGAMPPLPPGVAPVVEENTSYTPEQFKALTAKTLRELPTPAALRDIGEEEAHGYPEPLAKAGPLLGRIAQAAQNQPALKDQATDFYVSCTQDREILIPVRALCYSHLLKDPKAPPAESLPPEVVRLAKLIPAEGP